MQVTNVLEKIGDTSSTLEKCIVLKEHDSELLRRVLEAAYNPYITYGVVNVDMPANTQLPHRDDEVIDQFLYVLQDLATRSQTGSQAREAVVAVLTFASERARKVCLGILEKNLRIGIAEGLINKTFPKLIPKFAVMLAEPFTEEDLGRWETVEVIIEPKIDGIRMISIIDGKSISLFSRNGQTLRRFLPVLELELQSLSTGVYDGELTGPSYRALMTQVHRKEDDPKAANLEDVVYQIFDFVELGEWRSGSPSTPLRERRTFLKTQQSSTHVKFDIIQKGFELRKQVNWIRKVHDNFVRNFGYEGIMVKDPTALYERRRSKRWLKLKAQKEIDLKIVDFEEGTGRNSGVLGAFIVDFNGEQVKVGSGFTDMERAQFWREKESLIAKTVEIKYQDITTNQRGTRSLRFPVFASLRPDKD